MAFIKTQKLVFNEDGTIKSGSAALLIPLMLKMQSTIPSIR